MVSRRDRPWKVMWNGYVFVPWNRDIPRIQEALGEGEILYVERHEERDMNSHRHYHAQIGEAWKNLPEELEAEYPTPEHLRKKMLIKEGYADMKEIVCDTARDAAVVAAFIAPLNEYGIVTVSGNVIRIFTAKSQAVAAMGKSEFQESKWKVLNAIAALIQTSPRQLERNTGQSA